jgi:hypothetical protein
MEELKTASKSNNYTCQQHQNAQPSLDQLLAQQGLFPGYNQLSEFPAFSFHTLLSEILQSCAYPPPLQNLQGTTTGNCALYKAFTIHP